MQRMIQSHRNSQIFASLVVVAATLIGSPSVSGQSSMVRQADADFDASGYVTPAGMAPPSMYHGSVQPVGYCDSAPCDSGYGSYGGCDSCGPGGCGYQSYSGCDSCGGTCGPFGCGGILGKLTTGGGGMSGMRHCCLFCRGGGCSACQFLGKGYLLGALQALMPYREAGLCAQRWYDLSAEAMFLSHSGLGIGTDVITRQGPDQNGGPNGVPVLVADDILNDGLEAGVRLSASLIFGAGGNLEATYLGGQEWSDSASAVSPAVFDNAVPPNLIGGADLFSFISDFGVPTIFDDTDRSVSQTASYDAHFHSGEFNYRRRTVGPYCRFQGSWLVGMRYLRHDSHLGLDVVGLNNNGLDNGTRSFQGHDQVKNDLWGAQLGGDLWWNVIPGINFGIGIKGAWLNNNVSESSAYEGNSFVEVASQRDQDKGTVAGELEATILYRLSHSWSLRSSYYVIGIDDVAHANFDADYINAAAQANPRINPPAAVVIPPQSPIQFDTLTLQGFTFGAEYIW